MERKKRIIFLEDMENWRNIVSTTMRLSGYHIDTAATKDEAKKLLRSRFYHLAICDVSLIENNDEDRKGIEFIEDYVGNGNVHTGADFRAMQFVILTAYPSIDLIRESFTKLEVSDFFSKLDFDNLEFAQEIDKIFQKDVHSNLALDIMWGNKVGAKEVVRNLTIGDERVRRDSALERRVLEELDELLCRLFHKAHRIMVRPLTRGMSGASVLWVQPYFAERGAAQPVVVKFGYFEHIRKENESYQTYVKDFIGGSRSTTILSVRRTALLGGIIYSLVGGAEDSVESFGEFYTGAKADVIQQVTTNLFKDTCRLWYANLGQPQPVNLVDTYSESIYLSLERLHGHLNKLKSVRLKQDVTFEDLTTDKKFVNPLFFLKDFDSYASTYMVITHGDLNPGNILVDQFKNTWLIDFQQASKGHFLRDFAELDNAIRLELIPKDAASLEERYAFELALLQGYDKDPENERFSENPHLCKAFTVIRHLRKLAVDLAGTSHPGFWKEYQTALLLYALKFTTFMKFSSVQRLHGLLAACLLSEHLRQTA